jgi:hypothetical protein
MYHPKSDFVRAKSHIKRFKHTQQSHPNVIQLNAMSSRGKREGQMSCIKNRVVDLKI